tara:strand:- start:417 stop:608 length:192 start_codon:yes stop_codon:yes gene_type:complete
MDTLSAPQFSNLLISSMLLTPPPTVNGTKHFLEVFSTTSKIISLFSFEAVISRKQISSAPPSE